MQAQTGDTILYSDGRMTSGYLLQPSEDFVYLMVTALQDQQVKKIDGNNYQVKIMMVGGGHKISSKKIDGATRGCKIC